MEWLTRSRPRGAFALPILVRGSSTVVVTVGDRQAQPSCTELLEYLKWHGINAEAAIVPTEQSESSTYLPLRRASKPI